MPKQLISTCQLFSHWSMQWARVRFASPKSLYENVNQPIKLGFMAVLLFLSLSGVDLWWNGERRERVNLPFKHKNCVHLLRPTHEQLQEYTNNFNWNRAVLAQQSMHDKTNKSFLTNIAFLWKCMNQFGALTNMVRNDLSPYNSPRRVRELPHFNKRCLY